MRPQVTTQTGVGNGTTIPVNYKQENFKVSFGCVITGTVTYKVQHTLDNVYDAATTAPVFFDHSFAVGQTANADGNYEFPIMALRLVVTAGTGSVTMTVLQG